jgi:hypothetical protein
MTSNRTEYTLSEPTLWFFDFSDRFYNPEKVTTELLYRYQGRLQVDALFTSFQQVFQTYPNLSCQYQKTPSGIRQVPCDVPKDQLVDVVDLTDETSANLHQRMTEKCDQVRNGFRLATGELSKLVVFKTSDDSGYFWMSHQFVQADLITARLIFAETMRHYRRLLENQPLVLRKVDDYNKWMAQFHEFREQMCNEDFFSYWNRLPWEKVRLIPSDGSGTFRNRQDLNEAFQTRKPEDFVLVKYRLTLETSNRLIKHFGKTLHNASCAMVMHALGKVFNTDWLLVNTYNSVLDLTQYGASAPPKTLSILGRHSAVGVLVLDTHRTHAAAEAVQGMMKQMKETPYGGIGFYDLRKRSDKVTVKNFETAISAHGIEYNFLGELAPRKQETLELEYSDEPLTGYDSYSIYSQKGFTDQLLRIRLKIVSGQFFFEIMYFKPYFSDETIAAIQTEIRVVFEDLMLGDTVAVSP